MIKLDYKDGRSLHEQIEDGIKSLIISGIFKTDEQLPSVRELSLNLTVNPNTVQKAYKQLEAEGYIYSIKGKGNFISPVSGKKDEKRIDELYEILSDTLKELKFHGETRKQTDNILNDIFKEG